MDITTSIQNGVTILWCGSEARIVDALPTQQHSDEINRIRNLNRKPEVEKFKARMRLYAGTIPESLRNEDVYDY